VSNVDRRTFLALLGVPAVAAALPQDLEKALAIPAHNRSGTIDDKGVTAMTHHTRKDLPYQFALADAFTICDNYHCSLMGPTDPNRYHM